MACHRGGKWEKNLKNEVYEFGNTLNNSKEFIFEIVPCSQLVRKYGNTLISIC